MRESKVGKKQPPEHARKKNVNQALKTKKRTRIRKRGGGVRNVSLLGRKRKPLG